MKKTMSFEEAMRELEEIVRKMQDEELSLDESMELYTEALKLTKFCTTKLEAAKKKIENQAGARKNNENLGV